MDRCNANVSGKLDKKLRITGNISETRERGGRENNLRVTLNVPTFTRYVIIEKIFLYLSPTAPHALSAPNYFFFLFSIMICRHVLTRNHHWLYMYIQGMLRNKKDSLTPNDCHCGESN